MVSDQQVRSKFCGSRIAQVALLELLRDPKSLLSLAELGFELTLSAMLAIISIHLNRNAIQRQIAEQITADSLGHAPTRTRARNSRRRS